MRTRVIHFPCKTLIPVLALAGSAGLMAAASVRAEVRPDRVIAQYKAWTVTCETLVATETAPGSERCAMEQSVTDSASGATVMRLTIATGADMPAPVGTIVGPFGVDLAQGIGLSVDGVEAGRVSFLTCLQIGCVANLALDEAQVAAFRGGESLVAVVHPSDNPAAAISLTFSLGGFADALARLQAGTGAAP